MSTTRLTTRAGNLEVALNRDQHARLEEALGWQIAAVGGTLWVTQDGDSRDVVLAPGASFTFDRNHALVSSFGRATAQLQRADAGAHHACLNHAHAELALAA